MEIDGVLANYKAQIKSKKSVPVKELKNGKLLSDKDQYIPSIAARTLAMDSIRQKVKSGFYSSDMVAEDISDKFAKLFEAK